MAHLRLILQIEQVSINLVAGQSRCGKGGYEPSTCVGENHAHSKAVLAQQADQLQPLVSGDAAADDQKDPFGHAVHLLRPSSAL